MKGSQGLTIDVDICFINYDKNIHDKNKLMA